jgi:uncharacterized protein YybS (DUF2232 family)
MKKRGCKLGNYEDKDKIKELLLIFLLTATTGYLGISRFPLLMMLFPALSVAIGVKYGLRYNMVNIGLSIITISLIAGLTYIPALSIYIGLAAILNLGMNRDEKASKVVLKGGTYMFLALSLISIALKIYFEIDILESLKTSLETGLADTLRQLESAGTDYDMATIKSVMQSSIDFMVSIFPAILAFGAFFISTISYVIASYIVKKSGRKSVEVPKLSGFRLSSAFSLSSVVILVVVLAMKLFGVSAYRPLVSNLTFILYMLVFIQGLGVVSYFLNKTRMHSILKWIILIFLALNAGLSMVVSFVGVLDIVFNFRKIKD